MAALKRLIITPYFGKFPTWFDKFEPPVGYDWLLDVNLNGFKDRVKRVMGIEYPGVYGGTKVWDYRCAFGALYQQELRGYDYWATMDFDMCFGDVNKWFPDDQLKELAIWSNHNTYICGPWTLYANHPVVNFYYDEHPQWKEILSSPETTAWVENDYSKLVEEKLKYKYSFFQGDPYNPPFNLKKVDGKLFQDGVEIPMLHFRRDKRWPL